MSLRILVVGAGAVGGYFGARLAAAGRDVTFLVRPRRAAELSRTGLQVVSPLGNLHLQPTLVTTDTLSGRYDVILLSVKSYALEQAIDDFAPAVGEHTLVLPMLNGMRHIDLLTKRFGNATLGSICRIIGDMDAEGRIVQMTSAHELRYGELDGQRTPRVERLHETLSNAGFDAHISDDAVQDLWEKWLQLATLGALTCLFRGAVGEILAVPHGRDTALTLVHECASILQACGHPATPRFLERCVRMATEKGSTLTASMYRDLQKGLPVEADAIVGDLLRRGREHGIAAPLLTAAAVHLQVYQQALANART